MKKEEKILAVIKELEFEPNNCEVYENEDGNIAITFNGDDYPEKGYKHIAFVQDGEVWFD